MHHEFWHERWQSNQIGFHQDTAHPLLIEYWERLGLTPGTRVLVPLCGKSPDLIWLTGKGHSVVGVELSELAVRDFFAENGLQAAVVQPGHYTAGNIELIVGDFLATTSEALGPVDAVYDRAALIALPAPMRRDYARHVQKVAGSAPQLIISLDDPQDRISPPPFSVPEAELSTLYGGPIKVLGQRDSEVKGTPVIELAYLVGGRAQ